MRIDRDHKGQPMIEWVTASAGWKRAWIQHRSNMEPEKDWASTGRYLNVARTEGPFSGPRGNATDFPIWSNLPDEQILEAFVLSICAITGCEPVQAPPQQLSLLD